MVQAQFLLGTLETFLDGPAQPGGTGQLSQFSSSGGEDEVIRAVLRIAPIATDEDPALEAAIPHPRQCDARPVVEPHALGALAGRHAASTPQQAVRPPSP